MGRVRVENRFFSSLLFYFLTAVTGQPLVGKCQTLLFVCQAWARASVSSSLLACVCVGGGGGGGCPVRGWIDGWVIVFSF